ALELCDGLDNDCDGSVDEDQGVRYVAPGGDDAGNTCLDPAQPCASINHAVQVACDGETVSVAEGEYFEDVLIDHPVTVDGEGVPTRTILRGSGTVDVVRIFSSDVHWTAVNVYDTVGVACMRIGDSNHTGLRNVKIDNTSLAGCSIGAIWDSTGDPGPAGAWNTFLAASTRDNVYDGTPDSGIGTLMVGGNGKIQLKLGHLTNNDGPGLVIRPPTGGRTNNNIVLAGEIIGNDGNHPDVGSHVAVEIHQASDVRFEGNDFYQIQDRAVLLDQVTDATFFCNRLRDNGDGLVLTGGSTLRFEQNHFINNTGDAVRVEAGTGTGLQLAYSYFSGNGAALRHQGDGTISAVRSWWGAADGPGGDAPGSGDPVWGAVDTGSFFDAAPFFVRRPTESGWDPSPDTCYQSVQAAIDASADGTDLLIGEGVYKEHVTLNRPMRIEGIPPASGCPTAEIRGEQKSAPHLPVFRVSDTSGVSLSHLSIEGAGEGPDVTCGQYTGEEMGLELKNVSSSTFSSLCLSENGVTELRVWGQSSDNLFEDLTIDGVIRDYGGADACGHRSRTGIEIDGGAVCEGGAGTFAARNRIVRADVSGTTRAIALRLADDTEISSSTLSASPAPAWSDSATGILLALTAGTTLADNQVSGPELVDGVRLEPLRDGECVTERSNTTATTISGGSVTTASGAGIRILRGATDPGRVLGTSVSCLVLDGNATNLEADDAGGAGADANRIEQADLTGSGNGLVNHDTNPFTATGNWWGAADGPSGGGPGSGTPVQGAVTFGGWLLSPGGNDADGDGYSECDGDCDDQES
ncbi:MAG: right-handed parallel beta-helix repeat-containing protein, partial [Acidobacteriota bacterium]|nr:right-handed parallel beta-helix repeat-containing protein [Acidobacteriota bacterium]